MTNSRAAICIPTYNQADFLKIAVESALVQDYSPIEIVVSDDCSSDHTADVMHEICRKHPQVRYKRQEKNLGIAGNTNWLLNNVEAEFVIRFDSDNVLHPTFISRMVSELRKHPRAAYCHCAVDEIDAAGRKRRTIRLARKGGYQDSEEALKGALYGMRMTSFISLFRFSALKEVGFRPQMKFAEDWDCTIRLALAGWGNVYIPDVLALYRVWEDAGGVRVRRKCNELHDMIIIYDDYERIFQERGWDVEEVRRVRRERACGHAVSLANPAFSKEDRREIIALLKKLGDSKALQRRLKLVRLGLGPLIQWIGKQELKCVDFLKGLLYSTS